jgi:hypothetical protein
MVTGPRSFAAAAAATLLLPVPDVAEAASLRAYLWKNRPLLIFAPAPISDHLERQRSIVAANRNGMLERDMVVIEIVGGRVRTILGASTSMSAAALRRHYRVGDPTFRVILVGKDGGSKLRSAAPINAEHLFRLIDSMPMRRQEMRRRGS